MTNPLNLRGPEFLKLYVLLFVGATIAAIVLRAILRRTISADDAVPDREPALDPFELAYFAGGPGRALQAAVVSLVQQGSVRFRSTRDVSAVRAPGNRASPLEAGVYAAASDEDEGTMSPARQRCESALRRIEDRLISDGLL